MDHGDVSRNEHRTVNIERKGDLGQGVDDTFCAKVPFLAMRWDSFVVPLPANVHSQLRHKVQYRLQKGDVLDIKT